MNGPGMGMYLIGGHCWILVFNKFISAITYYFNNIKPFSMIFLKSDHRNEIFNGSYSSLHSLNGPEGAFYFQILFQILCSSRVVVGLKGRGRKETMVSGCLFLWENSTRLVKSSLETRSILENFINR